MKRVLKLMHVGGVILLGLASPMVAQSEESFRVAATIGARRLSVPSLIGSEVAYSIDEEALTFGGRVSKSVSTDGVLALTYAYSRHELGTRFTSFETEDESERLFRASADLNGHVLTLEMSLPLVEDDSSSRELRVSLGGGVMILNPSRNQFFFSPSEVPPGTPEDEQPPRELPLVVDPILSLGIGLRLPLSPGMAVRADFHDHVQYCDSDGIGSRHYFCPGWDVRQNYNVSVGIEVPF